MKALIFVGKSYGCMQNYYRDASFVLVHNSLKHSLIHAVIRSQTKSRWSSAIFYEWYVIRQHRITRITIQ